jgi:Domain of unknown function (DUF4167)
MSKRFPKRPRQRPDHARPAPGARAARPILGNRAGDHPIADAKRQYERYLALARTAVLNGDDVEAQNCYQHAEHFFRTMMGQDAN